MSVSHRIKAGVQDRPGRVTGVLACLVVVHFMLVKNFDAIPDPFGELAGAAKVTDLYLGAVGFSTLLAGFAGIVVVFAMSPGSDSLTRLRRAGGERIAANWIAPVSSSILSAFAALLATGFALNGEPTWSGWIFEFAVLALLHGAWRMVWLLQTLIAVVSAEDSKKDELPTVSLESLTEKRTA